MSCCYVFFGGRLIHLFVTEPQRHYDQIYLKGSYDAILSFSFSLACHKLHR